MTSPYDVYWSGRQDRILAFLTEYIKDHGYPPSMREIADGIGGASTSTISYELEVLEARGHITRTPGVARGITIVPRTPDAD